MLGDGIVLTYCFFPQQQNTRGKYAFLIYYSIYVFPYFEMWYNGTKPSTFRVFSLTWPVSMQDKVIETTTTKKTFTCRKSSTLTAFVWNTNMAAAHHVKPLSSAEAPARYPYKNSNNQKKKKARGERWEEGKGTLCFSFSAAFPQHKDASAEERDVKPWDKALYMFVCFYSSSHEISSCSIISSFWLGAALIEWYHDYHNFVRMGSVFSPNGGRHIQ